MENKSSVAIYGGGAIVVLWLSSTIVGAINSVPLVRSDLNDISHVADRVTGRDLRSRSACRV